MMIIAPQMTEMNVVFAVALEHQFGMQIEMQMV
jgi:hypothetical protein